MLDLSQYDGEDHYTDGDVEDDLLKIVKNGGDYRTVLEDDDRWPILCHLSPNRRNLLEWYPFDESKSLLEIGAGCGALTGLFCERTAAVTAVELSRKRAEIIESRHGGHDNLRVVVANFDKLELDERFDYVTLIGVLEYAGRFMSGDQPRISLLEKAADMMNPGAFLFLAIENALGVKYFSGAAEDHVGAFYSGIEGYPELERKITFGKKELEALVKQAGFESVYFYYPVPDYKLPEAVFSDERLPSVECFRSASPNYDKERLVTFNEQLAVCNILDNQAFPLFANSYLLICQK